MPACACCARLSYEDADHSGADRELLTRTYAGERSQPARSARTCSAGPARGEQVVVGTVSRLFSPLSGGIRARLPGL
jgi:hypothetical protein